MYEARYHKRPTKRWLQAYAAFRGQDVVPYQEELPLEAPKGDGVKKKRKRPVGNVLNCLTEQQEQFKAVAWLRKNNVLFYHVPNGGHRDFLEGVKFKRLGVSAGVPDLVVPVARKGHHGLYIELKRQSGGSVSDRQRWWLARLAEEGYDCYVAKGADDLILYVKNYLDIV